MPAPRKPKPQQDDAISVGSGVTVRRTSLDAYAADAKNPNKGGERNQAILRRSLRERGAGRSVLADKHGVLIAGNQTRAAAAEEGITEVIEIETDGTPLVVVKRRDLDLNDPNDTRARMLSYEDNRSRDGANWQSEIVAADAAAGLLDDLLFRADELQDLMAQVEADHQVIAAEAESASGRKTIDENRARVVRLAVFAKQVQVIERAIAAAQRATGIENRADLLEHICTAYIEGVDKEVKQ